MPSLDQAGQALDWDADLRGFLAVILGLPGEQMPALDIAPNAPSKDLQQLIARVQAEVGQASVFSQISTEELAHTFVVAMRLKVLSQQLEGLPQTRVAPHCWWAAGQGNNLAWAQLNEQVGAGHYDMLKQPGLLQELLQRLPRAEAVMG
ncbi:hypothetical protein D9M71_183820 [compost metagenome]